MRRLSFSCALCQCFSTFSIHIMLTCWAYWNARMRLWLGFMAPGLHWLTFHPDTQKAKGVHVSAYLWPLSSPPVGSSRTMKWLRSSLKIHIFFYPVYLPLEDTKTSHKKSLAFLQLKHRNVVICQSSPKAVDLTQVLPFLEVIFQTLVHTDTVSIFSGVSSGTGSWFFGLEENPLKTGQIGMYFRKAILCTTLIPKGKS